MKLMLRQGSIPNTPCAAESLLQSADVVIIGGNAAMQMKSLVLSLGLDANSKPKVRREISLAFEEPCNATLDAIGEAILVVVGSQDDVLAQVQTERHRVAL
jgi:hypothetical protein